MAAIITAAQARRWIPGLTGTSEDAILNDLIDSADSALAEYCNFPYCQGESPPDSQGKTLLKEGYQFFLEGDILNPLVLRLPVWPLSGDTPTVHMDPSREYGASTLLVDGTDFEVLNVHSSGSQFAALLIKPKSSIGAWSTAFRSCRVQIQGGYSTLGIGYDDLPKDIQVACGLLVAHWYQLRHTSGLTNVSQAGGSAGLVSGAIPDNVKEIMKPYRLSGNWIG